MALWGALTELHEEKDALLGAPSQLQGLYAFLLEMRYETEFSPPLHLGDALRTYPVDRYRYRRPVWNAIRDALAKSDLANGDQSSEGLAKWAQGLLVHYYKLQQALALKKKFERDLAALNRKEDEWGLAISVSVQLEDAAGNEVLSDPKELLLQIVPAMVAAVDTVLAKEMVLRYAT